MPLRLTIDLAENGLTIRSRALHQELHCVIAGILREAGMHFIEADNTSHRTRNSCNTSAMSQREIIVRDPSSAAAATDYNNLVFYIADPNAATTNTVRFAAPDSIRVMRDAPPEAPAPASLYFDSMTLSRVPAKALAADRQLVALLVGAPVMRNGDEVQRISRAIVARLSAFVSQEQPVTLALFADIPCEEAGLKKIIQGAMPDRPRTLRCLTRADMRIATHSVEQLACLRYANQVFSISSEQESDCSKLGINVTKLSVPDVTFLRDEAVPQRPSHEIVNRYQLRETLLAYLDPDKQVTEATSYSLGEAILGQAILASADHQQKHLSKSGQVKDRLLMLRKKYRKFRLEPARFFEDSKLPPIRFLNKLLRAISHGHQTIR